MVQGNDYHELLTWINFFFLLAEKIKIISLIRDKTNVIKNYLNAIEEESNLNSIPNGQVATNETIDQR